MADQDDRELSGLQYLTRERPEAMGHLLAFFKESACHLDPKTRFLISIVTKVINFSPRGLRQYIPRAMREGASRDEVMDVILCAYPAAGLTRVVDAIDVLRSLDLEDGAKTEKTNAPKEEGAHGEGVPGQQAVREREWVTVLRAGELEVDGARVVEAGGERIALFNSAGTYRAISNTCLHQGGFLGEGVLEGEVVTCSRHGWQFDVTNGDCLSHPGRGVEAYEVRVVEGEVQVFI
jgi:nitrite reductase/ring-hydroxylating ferredoxin subunit/alkylhydroperoxidase/carboxymuconolactone decarboxylase family protein YurZ